MMDQYDEEIVAMEDKLDRLSRLVGVLPDDSPERADVQDQGLLLYRELEVARGTLSRRRQLDAAIEAQEDRMCRHRAAADRRSGSWALGAAWTMVPGVLVVLISLPAQSWQLRLAGFALVIVGVLCLMRMAALQRQASQGSPGDSEVLLGLYEQRDRLESQGETNRRLAGQSPSASSPASTPEGSSMPSHADTLEIPRGSSV